MFICVIIISYCRIELYSKIDILIPKIDVLIPKIIY